MSDSPIAAMFDRISPNYDQLNHLLSLNTDKLWRQKTAKEVAQSRPKTILDLATGTADLAIEIAKRNPEAHIIGMDISKKMLEIGESKIKEQHLENQIDLHLGNAARLPFPNNSFDAVTVAFGVRNFEDLEHGLTEIYRVLKPNGIVFILEFSMPEKPPIKQIYRLYFKHILPKIGKIVSKEPTAYSYLPNSVERFPKPQNFMQLLAEHNLKNKETKQLSFGIAMLYLAAKN
jgi:demethylmenaquinone methyltransferase/2-methoxy-6-polyprenyl-1,4-benzoquinol methylase